MTYFNQFDLSLWTMCDGYYNQHQTLCLQLQDDHQVNVNLLLLSLWLDKQGYLLTPTDWALMKDEVHHWEERVLLPYRKLRKLSKNSLIEGEYQQMLEVELMLERKSQALILHKLRQLPHEGQSSNLNVFLDLYRLNANEYQHLAA